LPLFAVFFSRKTTSRASCIWIAFPRMYNVDTMLRHPSQNVVGPIFGVCAEKGVRTDWGASSPQRGIRSKINCFTHPLMARSRHTRFVKRARALQKSSFMNRSGTGTMSANPVRIGPTSLSRGGLASYQYEHIFAQSRRYMDSLEFGYLEVAAEIAERLLELWNARRQARTAHPPSMLLPRLLHS
jgi:hypothetical protein